MKSLHLLLVVVAAAMPSPQRKDNENDIIWFPVDGEKGVFVSTKGEIYISSSISNRGRRQRRYSNRHSNDAVYFSYENDDDNDERSESESAKRSIQSMNAPLRALTFFHESRNHVPLLSQSFQNNKIGVKHPGKNQKHVNYLKEEKDFFSDFPERHDSKKYISNHHQHYQEFLFHQPEENRYLHDKKHYHHHHHHHHYDQETNFENVKPVTELVDESPFPNSYAPPLTRPRGKQISNLPTKQGNLINSNGQQNPNFFKPPNKSGDFTFPDYDSDGFYTSSEAQHHNHFNDFHHSQNNQKPPDLVFSRPTPEFTNYPISSAHPTWSATPSPSDDFIFPGDTDRNTRPPSGTTSSRQTTVSQECERTCLVTTEFNPVCGTDFVTYSNIGKLKCALKCGKDVHFYHYGSCGRSNLATPLH